MLAMTSAPAIAETQAKTSTRGIKMVRIVQPPVFNWFANGNRSLPHDQAVARTKAAIVKARSLGAGATWVCSPAGSGRGSDCYRG